MLPHTFSKLSVNDSWKCEHLRAFGDFFLHLIKQGLREKGKQRKKSPQLLKGMNELTYGGSLGGLVCIFSSAGAIRHVRQQSMEEIVNLEQIEQQMVLFGVCPTFGKSISP